MNTTHIFWFHKPAQSQTKRELNPYLFDSLISKLLLILAVKVVMRMFMEGSIKFTEAKLEQAIIELLGEQGYDYLPGEKLPRTDKAQVLIEADLRHYLSSR